MSVIRKIGIANEKGGVGKTTAAINVAACLEEAGYSVLAIDLDLQRNFTDAMLQDRVSEITKTIINVAAGECEVGEACYPIYIKFSSKVRPKRVHIDMIPAPENEDVKFLSDPLALRKAFESISDKYDYVIMDFPPERPYAEVGENGKESKFSLSSLALNACDEIITPCTTDTDSLKGFSILSKHVSIIKQLYNPTLEKMSFYISSYAGYSAEKEFLDYCETMPSYSGICIPSSGIVKGSKMIDRPLAWYNTNSKVAQAFKQLAEYIR